MNKTTAMHHRLALGMSVALLVSVSAWGYDPEWPPARPMDWICPGEEENGCEHAADHPVTGIAWADDFAAAAVRCAAEEKPILISFNTRAKGVAGAPYY